MHSYHHPSGINIHHNGDYSGGTKISIPASLIDHVKLSDIVYLDDEGNLWINNIIPAEAIADFGFGAAINHVISTLEQLERPQH
jgi:hypothetical protein